MVNFNSIFEKPKRPASLILHAKLAPPLPLQMKPTGSHILSKKKPRSQRLRGFLIWRSGRDSNPRPPA